MSNLKEEILDPLPGTLLKRLRITYVPTGEFVEGVPKSNIGYDMYKLRFALRKEIMVKLKIKSYGQYKRRDN